MKVAGGCLIVLFNENPSDQAEQKFQREVFEESIRRKTAGVIFDASDVSFMDSFMCRSMVALFRISHILGKRTVVVGLKPAVVLALIDQEIDLSRIRTAVNIDEAIALINPVITDIEPFEGEEPDIDEDDEAEENDENEEAVFETQESASE